MECLKSTGWIEHLIKWFRPLLRVLGLSDQVATIFIAAILFGLLYGSAVIVEETKRGIFTKEELQDLHVSIGINHAIVEDPALFMLLGLNGLWMLLPRFIMAVVSVYILRSARLFIKKLGLTRYSA